MNNTIPTVVLAGLVSGVAAAVVVTLLTPRTAPVPVSTQPVHLTPISERLEGMERKIEALATQVSTFQVMRMAVQEPTGEPDDQTAVPARVAPTVGSEVSRRVPENWTALHSLAARAEADYDNTMKDFGLLTVPEWVRRFGSPTRVQSSSNGGFTMSYFQVGLDGKPTPGGQFYVRVVDAYVVSFQWRL